MYAGLDELSKQALPGTADVADALGPIEIATACNTLNKSEKKRILGIAVDLRLTPDQNGVNENMIEI